MNSLDKVLELARTHHFEQEHSLQVTALALQFFDQLQFLHRLDKDKRQLLQAAGFLHDIGRTNGGSRHHKIARDIILNSPALPFNGEEKAIVALVARYHRKSLPNDTHQDYNQLSPASKSVVKKLASFLRLADGLDRSHLSVVKDIKVDNFAQKIVVHVRASQFSPVDKAAGEEKADLFEQVFNKKVNIDWRSD